MKAGDFVIYRTPHGSDIGVLIKLNYEGGTVKALNTRGQIVWYVWSGCEVISEGRRPSEAQLC